MLFLIENPGENIKCWFYTSIATAAVYLDFFLDNPKKLLNSNKTNKETRTELNWTNKLKHFIFAVRRANEL